MNRFNIVVLVFGSALLLFLYQNCQKAAFTKQESSSDSLSLPNLDYKYKSISMSGSGGYMACMERCLTSGQISLNLESAKLSVKGYWMGLSFDPLPMTSTTPAPPVDDSPPEEENLNLTDFELNLNASELELLRSISSSLNTTEHVIPACNPCAIVMDMPHVMHELKDYNDIKKNVYLHNFIDPNINGVTVSAYSSANELQSLVCKINQKVQSSNLKSSLKSDTVAILHMVTHVDLERISCP
jgi:hypothetical protein